MYAAIGSAIIFYRLIFKLTDLDTVFHESIRFVSGSDCGQMCHQCEVKMVFMVVWQKCRWYSCVFGIILIFICVFGRRFSLQFKALAVVCTTVYFGPGHVVTFKVDSKVEDGS